MMWKEFEIQKEKYKIALVAGLLACSCMVMSYFQISLETGTVVAHIFYIPIIFAAVWWGEKGLIVAGFSSAFLVFNHIFLRPDATTNADYFQALMFMVVCFLAAKLSEHIAKEKDTLAAVNQQLTTSNRELDTSNQQIRATDQQLKASNQQLGASNQQLRATEQLLRASNQQLRADEEELRQAAAKYKAMFDFSMNGIAVYEGVNNGKDFIFKDLNPAAEKMEKVKKQDFMGRSVQDVFPGIEEMGLLDVLRRVWKTGKEEFMPAAFYKDGRIEVWKENYVFKLLSGEVVAVYKDITELKQAEERLNNNQEHLRALAVQLSLSEEHERRRIAEGLHDEIIQPLIFLDIKLKTLLDSCLNSELTDSYRKMRTVINKLVGDVRDFTFDLSYPVLHELGFEKAVNQWLISEIKEKHGLEVVFEDDRQGKPLDDSVETFLFKAVKELLINVVKHAKATKVKVALARDHDNIEICVEDNGVGFSFDRKSNKKMTGFGLFNIHNRIDYLGGSIEIESRPGGGTQAVIKMPLKPEKAI